MTGRIGNLVLTLAAGPPEAVTPDTTVALARCLAAGVLATVPGQPGDDSQLAQ